MCKMFSSRKNIEELLIDPITQCCIISQWWLWFLCDRTNFRLKSKQDFMPLWACNTHKLRKHLLEPCSSKSNSTFWTSCTNSPFSSQRTEAHKLKHRQLLSLTECWLQRQLKLLNYFSICISFNHSWVHMDLVALWHSANKLSSSKVLLN